MKVIYALDHETSFTYDKVGNRLTKTDPSGTVNYVYDENDRLVSVQTSGGSLLAYAYDADGMRVRSTVDGTATGYLVDSNKDFAQVLEERNGAGDVQASYAYGDELISQNRAGVVSYYHYDGLGSTRALSDGSGIAIQNSFRSSYIRTVGKTFLEMQKVVQCQLPLAYAMQDLGVGMVLRGMPVGFDVYLSGRELASQTFRAASPTLSKKLIEGGLAGLKGKFEELSANSGPGSAAGPPATQHLDIQQVIEKAQEFIQKYQQFVEDIETVSRGNACARAQSLQRIVEEVL